MSISVDTVYQRVLGILNKEQRGFLPPQEFNLYANQVQEDIFEQYFYDINQFLRVPGNDTEYSDMIDNLNEKIDIFQTEATLAYSDPYYLIPSTVYRLGTVIYNNKEVELIQKNELLYILNSPISSPSNVRPIFVRNGSGIKVYGTDIFDGTEVVSATYIRKPAKVVWGYTEAFDTPLYNASASTDFELHISEEPDVVVKILALAGLEIKDLSLYQIAAQEDNKNIQQEKS